MSRQPLRPARGARVRISALIVPVIVAGASSVHADSPPELFPGGVGSRWVYQVRMTTQQSGVAPESTQVEIEGRVISVVRAGSQRKIVMRMGTKEFQTGTDTYLLDQKELLRVSTGTGGIEKMTPPLPLLKAPIKPGRAWAWKGVKLDAAGAPHDASAEVKVGVRELVKTPAGSYRAYRVMMNLTAVALQGKVAVPTSIWFAPGVGMVRIAGKVAAGPMKMDFDMRLSRVSIK